MGKGTQIMYIHQYFASRIFFSVKAFAEKPIFGRTSAVTGETRGVTVRNDRYRRYGTVSAVPLTVSAETFVIFCHTDIAGVTGSVHCRNRYVTAETVT